MDGDARPGRDGACLHGCARRASQREGRPECHDRVGEPSEAYADGPRCADSATDRGSSGTAPARLSSSRQPASDHRSRLPAGHRQACCLLQEWRSPAHQSSPRENSSALQSPVARASRRYYRRLSCMSTISFRVYPAPIPIGAFSMRAGRSEAWGSIQHHEKEPGSRSREARLNAQEVRSFFLGDSLRICRRERYRQNG
jgi:hypothetical protein